MIIINLYKEKGFIIIILLCFLTVSASSQDNILQKRIKLKYKKTTVRKIILDILPQEGINLSYNDQLIPFNKKVSFYQLKPKLSTILFKICSNEYLTFIVENNQILFLYYDRPDTDFSFIVSGKVRDKYSGELLLGATIRVLGTSNGVITNGYGYFSLVLHKGKHEIMVSYLGYKPIVQELDLYKNMKFDYHLETQSFELENLVIEEKQEIDIPIESVLSGVNNLNIELVGDLPYFLGEVDVFQSALLFPGILSIGEGASGINVRGSASDENLILLDEAVIYNSNHFFGLISVFNPDAINDIKIFKGSFPSKYGGRISSVMHIRHKDGNNKELHMSGGIGLITSRLLVEGPIKKDSSSFLISGRSTFWDFFTRGSKNPTIKNSRANFQDLNTKVNYNINQKNKIYFSGYIGTDVNKFGFDILKKWGNRLFSVRWNKIHSDRLFYNFTSYVSRYQYQTIEENKIDNFVGTSKIIDYALKGDFTYFFKPNNLIEYGFSIVYHQLSPGNRIQTISGISTDIKLENEQAIETEIYIANERNLSKKLKISYGLRGLIFSNIGPGSVFQYESGKPKNIDTIIDTLKFSSGESIQNFYKIHPRFSLNYLVNNSSSFKFNYFNASQYIHLLSNTLSPTSADIWKLSDNYILPTITNQVSLGYYKKYTKQKIETSIEVFYKQNTNIIDYKNGADLRFNNAIEKELLRGNSRAFGLELFIKKEIKNFTGWLGYTLFKSEKQVKGQFAGEAINNGEYFPTDYDRTHDFSIALIFKIHKRWTLSSNFVYYTGRPFSFPDSKYTFEGLIIPHFSNRNKQRLTPYHRLDLSATLEGKKIKKNGKQKKFKSYWVFSIYNAYNRKNTQAYFFRQNPADPTQTEIIKYSVLGIVIPSIKYNFRF